MISNLYKQSKSLKKTATVISLLGLGTILAHAAPFSDNARLIKRDASSSVDSVTGSDQLAAALASSSSAGLSTPIIPPLFWFGIPGIDSGSSDGNTDDSSSSTSTATETVYSTISYTDSQGSLIYTLTVVPNPGYETPTPATCTEYPTSAVAGDIASTFQYGVPVETTANAYNTPIATNTEAYGYYAEPTTEDSAVGGETAYNGYETPAPTTQGYVAGDEATVSSVYAQPVATPC